MSIDNWPVDSLLFLESMGWRPCGAGYWDHTSRPLEQFSTEDALLLAREDHRRQCLGEPK